MPEFTQDEYDRCPYCGKYITIPPTCCEAMEEECKEEFDYPIYDEDGK
jgi:hypothetical protein